MNDTSLERGAGGGAVLREGVPWLSRWLLIDIATIEARLAQAEAVGLVERAPNPWQVTLGVARMWHRVLFRADTIGVSEEHPTRKSWRARFLAHRPLRFPFLLAERAIAPWDFSGLLSSPARVVQHLLGAHHDGVQFAYDLQLLACHPGAIDRLRCEARAVVSGSSPRARWLRDLVVYENYHETLVAWLDGGMVLSADQERDPDITLSGYLRWCAAQPATPSATWRAWRRGAFTLSSFPHAAVTA